MARPADGGPGRFLITTLPAQFDVKERSSIFFDCLLTAFHESGCCESGRESHSRYPPAPQGHQPGNKESQWAERDQGDDDKQHNGRQFKGQFEREDST